MKYLLITLLFASCTGNYTIRTDYGTYRNLQKEELCDITYQLDSIADSGSHSFVLYQRKFMGRDYIMMMVDTIPEFFLAEDYEGHTYIGTDFWFVRKMINK